MSEPSLPTFSSGLLSTGDPHPVIQEGRGLSKVLVVCDHAGNAVPSRLALGVGAADLRRHIGWDMGALGVARYLAQELGAELIAQRYSRLVIDCNRPPSEAAAFPARVDGTDVPGNASMAAGDAAARVAEIFHPYHSAISSALDRRLDAGVEPIIVSVHSFTPFHSDFPDPRPWEASVIYDKNPELSKAIAAHMRSEGVKFGENEPYAPGMLQDYTMPVHGDARGIAHTLIEIRQNLIASADAQREWGARIARAVNASLAETLFKATA
ncbi:MAG: N-formylglutamate amidohydrolase [Pseudomonadota bacterium]